MSLWHILYFLVRTQALSLRHYRHQIHDRSVLTWIFHWLSAQHLLTCLTCNIPLLLQTVCHCTSASGAYHCPPPLPLHPLLSFLTNKHHHSKLQGGLGEQIHPILTPQFLTLAKVKHLSLPYIHDSVDSMRKIHTNTLWMLPVLIFLNKKSPKYGQRIVSVYRLFFSLIRCGSRCCTVLSQVVP